MLDLSGLVAVVTGAGTGIGARTAHVLAEHGADVVLAGRKAGRLEETADRVRENTGRAALVVPTDVREPDQVQNLMESGAARFGRLDIVVNNAGGAYMFPLKNTTPERWRNSVDLNLTSAYLCSQAALSHLLASPSAAIVNISSAAGVSGVKGGASYSAAKAGLQMFTRVRVGYPDDIAQGVLFFVSPMSSWVTGQTLSIDGGPLLGGLTDDELWPDGQ
jgi:NAD(P)-dependent dehydrogenase (short-subunit alcohol dehydrogenase family)